MTLIRYLYSNVSISHANFEVELRSCMTHGVRRELGNRHLNRVANCLRLIAEESHDKVPRCRDTLKGWVEVFL